MKIQEMLKKVIPSEKRHEILNKLKHRNEYLNY